jgi:hypothetical protein
MHDEFKKVLAGTSMIEEDVEFFAMSLLALLKQQQKVKGIPDQVFRRKFTTLFRLYEPLLQHLYDRPAMLIRTFLLWENNFFARIPKLHHRDEARENNMDLIIQLVDTCAGKDEVEDTVQAAADELLEKIEQQRIKSEEIKARKHAEGQKAKTKPKSTFEMTDEQGDAEKSALTHILGYIKELDSAIVEAEAAVKKRGQAPTQRVDDEQTETEQYIQRMVADTRTVLDKAREAGIRPEDMDGRTAKDDAELSDAAAAGPALPTLPAQFASSGPERSFWRTRPVLRNLGILQGLCRSIESSMCYESLRASRVAVAVLHAERQRLREHKPSNASEAKEYIAHLTEWDANITSEMAGVNEEYNQVEQERLNIERKAKFAKYIDAVKSKNLRLDGNLDEQFQVKAKFHPVVDKAKAAAAVKAAGEGASKREADDTRAELLQRGRMQRGHHDEGSDDES